MSETRRRELQGIPRVSPAEAQALVGTGDAVLVDTRARRFFDEAHAAGALSLPMADVRRSPEEAIRGLDVRERTLIFYCT